MAAALPMLDRNWTLWGLMSRRRRPQGLFWSGAAKLRGHAPQPIHHMPFEARAAHQQFPFTKNDPMLL